MPIFLLYFAGAGMFAGGAYLLHTADRQRVAEEARNAQQLQRDLLNGEIGLAELRARAADAGVDVEAVTRAYHEVLAGRLDLNSVAAKLIRELLA